MNKIIFDQNRLALHLRRAEEDFLLRIIMQNLASRLDDINHVFPNALDLSPLKGIFQEYAPEKSAIKKVENFCPYSEELPFADESFELVISGGIMQWINDIPKFLIQVKRILKADGLFIAIMPGGETLKELRASFQEAEIKLKGGISPRISPFIDIRDAGSLLQRAGFALPVADREILDIVYDNPLKLMHELRKMGQGNALIAAQKNFTARKLIENMVDYYQQNFSRTEDGKIRATFELITMTAWKPHHSQQLPAKRGSGNISLKETLIPILLL